MKNYWNHPAVKEQLNTNAEYDPYLPFKGNYAHPEDILALVKIGVRFPHIEKQMKK